MRVLRWFLLICGFVLAVLWILDLLLPSPVPEDIAWSTRVVDRQGKTLRLFTTPGGYWRLPAKLDTIDPGFVELLLAYEDKRFWSHPGVDIFALCRASLQCLASGRVVSGASTITMQVVRLLTPRPRTVGSKLVEMFQALRLERRLSKKEILELYLSLAPQGGNIQGVEAACLLYCNSDARHITPSQGALLISLPQSPERRRPDRHLQRAYAARTEVLERLFSAGLLSREELDLAAVQPLPNRRYPTPFYAAQLAGQFWRKSPGDQQIVTSLDYDLQVQAEAIAQRFQKGLAKGKTLALLVVDNNTREVLVHVGSGGFRISQIDLTRAIRSPGSTLKPFIYGLAFERGFLHPETRILDQQLRFQGYGPENFDETFRGWVTVGSALQDSLNLPAVQVLNRLGPQRLLSRLSSAGVSLRYTGDPGLSLALGGAGCSLQDLVSLYCALANGGQYRSLVTTPTARTGEAKTLLSPVANWYVDAILRSNPLPAGLVRNDRRRGTMRFKTGTSYGFRDAWAVGYDQDYTVGVWVGRPDGGYGKETTGANTAVPVLLQLFAALPAGEPGPEPGPPQGALLVKHQGLPRGLRWFDGLETGSAGADRPRISYPVDGSVLELIADQGQRMVLPLKVRGGTPPFSWLINGRLVAKGMQKEVSYAPQSAGMLRITLIDGLGQSARTAVWLEEPAQKPLLHFPDNEVVESQ
ncbi:MAG: penicillin-binding protein 1C [Deltaproteobacteria bacterium]|nr:MAG: penicillin-binding protein 1C [Deltaproteobacteria bacterium]